MLKNLASLPFLFCLFLLVPVGAQTYRDSIDVTDYHIQIQIDRFDSSWIEAACSLKLTTTIPTRQLKLDLLNFKVDSVLSKEGPLDFIHREGVLSVNTKKLITDTFTLTVYYRGKPARDPRWGGFYFAKDEAYNFGVGMASIPPCFGRAWFPCIDNFTDRARYSFDITVPKGYSAACSGMLIGIDTLFDQATCWRWKLNQSIPTYLASMAVGPYSRYSYSFKTPGRDLPVTLFERPENMMNAKMSLEHLPLWTAVFEERFGPYRWDRIGYVMVPFRGGAMEHACNITLSRNTVRGDLSREDLYAHELSHAWFGNLVTCTSEKDMWLNEGWASYAESIMQEGLYGRSAFLKSIRENQAKVIQSTHETDQGYYSVYGVPHALTYGSTVYDKGALVVHNLRGILGDSLFFGAVKGFLESYAFQSATVMDLQQSFSKYSNIDLNNFFNFWVYHPGFNELTLDATEVEKSGKDYLAKIELTQNLLGTSFPEREIRTDLLIIGNQLEKFRIPCIVQGSSCSLSITLPFKPALFILDPDERRLDATMQDCIDLHKGIGKVNTACSFSLAYENQPENAVLQVELHAIPLPASKQEKHIYQPGDFYWTIGIAGTLSAQHSATFIASINPGTSTPKLLYKKKMKDEWNPVKGARSTLSDGTIGIILTSLKPGWYALSQ